MTSSTSPSRRPQTVGDIVEQIVGGYDWDRLSKEAKESKHRILADYIEQGTSNNDKIVDFLNECEEQDYRLDADDIKHILNMDFDYVRKQELEVGRDSHLDI